jgi:hypothetical protein
MQKIEEQSSCKPCAAMPIASSFVCLLINEVFILRKKEKEKKKGTFGGKIIDN